MKEFLVKNQNHRPPWEIWNAEKDKHQETPDRMERIEWALRRILELDPESKIVYPDEFVPLPIELVKEVHGPDYVDFILSTAWREQIDKDGNPIYRYPSVFGFRRSGRTRQRNGELGYHSIDMYTPVHVGLAQASVRAAEAAYNATLEILNGNPFSYSIARPPGHHAGYDFMGGYCYFNNAAIAANVLSKRGKVGILDVDFHHGNGTQDIFREKQRKSNNPRVLAISIHADHDRMFPYFTGQTSADDAPLWMGIDYELGKYASNEEYDVVLGKAIRRLSDFAPDYLVVPVGFDTHERDPIADFKLTTDYYERMARQIAELKKPTVFVQEGGYNLDTIGNNITSFIAGIRQR